MKIMRWEEGYTFGAMGGSMRWVFWPQNGAMKVTLHYSVRQPGESFQVHTHEFSDDIVSVISGGGVVLTGDGREIPIETGQSVWVPAGEPHGFKNTGDVPMITIGSQGPPDPGIYKRAGFHFDIRPT